MVKDADFVITTETPFSKMLQDTTNARKGRSVWCIEPSRGARNVGAPDLNVAFRGAIYLVELKVRALTTYLKNPNSVPIAFTHLHRPSQIQFMKRVNDAGVYGYLALGYKDTREWHLAPVYTPDGRTVRQRGEIIIMEGSFDLAYAISQSLLLTDNV